MTLLGIAIFCHGVMVGWVCGGAVGGGKINKIEAFLLFASWVAMALTRAI